MNSRRICLACDLKPDDKLIAQYIEHHKPENNWPEINQSIRDAGIVDMEIYLIGNRLFMIMEVNDHFDPEKKQKMDEDNPKVQEWENLMMNFQQLIPWSEGEKWVEMERIYKL